MLQILETHEKGILVAQAHCRVTNYNHRCAKQCLIQKYVDLMQAMQLESLQETLDSKAADLKEATADYEEKLVSLSAELGKAAQRSQQHAAKVDLIKQVQVRKSCPCQHYGLLQGLLAPEMS